MPNPEQQKKPVITDWHWADVMAALKKRGWSLRQVGIAEGYPDGSSLGETARKNYPKAERILAAYAGAKHPMDIWPSRYDSNGQPNRRKGPAPMRGQPPRSKATTRAGGCNPQKAASR